MFNAHTLNVYFWIEFIQCIHILNRSLLTTTCAARIFNIICINEIYCFCWFDHLWNICKKPKKISLCFRFRSSARMMCLCMQWIWWCGAHYVISAFGNDHHYSCWQFLLKFFVRIFPFWFIWCSKFIASFFFVRRLAEVEIVVRV